MASAPLSATSQLKMADICWFLIVAILSSAWCLSSSAKLGPTFDEPTYLDKGLHAWRTGSYKPLMKLGTMPLPINMQTLPIYVVEKWRGQPFDVDKDMATILPWARSVTLLFWGILLFYGMLIGRHLAGPWGGRLAMVLLACEPSLIAHAGLATTDISVTALLLALGYHFSIARTSPWWLRVGIPATLYGLSLLAKASGLVYGPLILLAIEIQRFVSDGQWQRDMSRTWSEWIRFTWALFTPLRRDATQIVMIGLVIVFVVIGSEWKPEVTFTKWADGLPAGTFRDTMVWTFDNLCIFTNAGEGIVQQIKHNMRGHGSYILGETWRRSIWYYFPLAVTMKVTLTILIALAVGLLWNRRQFWTWPALAATALLLFSFNARVQIGIRLVLPLIAFGIIAIAIAFAESIRDKGINYHARWVMSGLMLAVIGWNGLTCARIWPNGLTYVNEMWGGSDTGYLCLSDSNYDWGQGLKELTRWTKDQKVDHLDVWYFGTDPAAKVEPLRRLEVHTIKEVTPESLGEHVNGKYLAVSTTFLHGSYLAKDPIIQYLQTCDPVDRTTTYMIFDVNKLHQDLGQTAEKRQPAVNR